MGNMVGTGGLYHDMMIKQSTTTAGLFSTMKDSLTFAGATLGSTLIKTLKINESMSKVSAWVTDIADRFAKWSEANPMLAKIVVYSALLLGLLAPILIILGMMASGIGALVTGLGMVMGILPLLTGLLGYLGVAINFVTWPVLLVVAALAALYFGLKYLVDSGLANSFFDGLFSGMEWLQGKFSEFVTWFMGIPSMLANVDWSGMLVNLLSAINPLAGILKLAGIDLSGSQSVDVNVKVGAEKGRTATATVQQSGKRGANM